MAGRVVLHVGLPKTGTTYLQSVLWQNRAALREQGLLYPGANRRQHMWASMVVREHPRLGARSPEAGQAWDDLLAEIDAWPGTALVSHEFFGGATAAQAAAALARLEDTPVDVVVTARDVLTVTSSYWQEHVKHGFGGVDLDDFPEDTEPWDEWGWHTQDLEGVLRRWSGSLPPERVHVLVLPGPGAPRTALMDSFAGILGIDASVLDTERARENASLGVVQVELLRLLAPKLAEFHSALDRGVWIRSYLAQGTFVPQGGDRMIPSDARVRELREKADRAVDYLAGAGFTVHGDPELLRVPAELPEGRHPSTVTDTEMLDAATTAITTILEDTRRLRRENTAWAKAQARAERAAAPLPGPGARVGRRLRRVFKGEPGPTVPAP